MEAETAKALFALTYGSKLNRWNLWLRWPTVLNWTDESFDCFDQQFQTGQMETLTALTYSSKHENFD